MHYPEIDSIIFSIGPVPIRWYGLMYLAAFGASWWLGNWRAEHKVAGWSRQDVSDLIFYGALGVVFGGRIGYCFFYKADKLLEDPLFLLRMWEGGMSFHGGLLGVAIAVWLFARRGRRTFLDVGDFVAPLVPIGLGFGRLGNFANTELPGRVSESGFGFNYPCWAVSDLNLMCYSQFEAATRHPSSLYQAFTEGALLFLLVWTVALKPRPLGVVSGTFLIGYGCFRFATEFFREPDADLGFVLLDFLSMGQILSIPMVIVGILLVVGGRRYAGVQAST